MTEHPEWTDERERGYRPMMRWLVFTVLAWLATIALVVAVLLNRGNTTLTRACAACMLIATAGNVITRRKQAPLLGASESQKGAD